MVKTVYHAGDFSRKAEDLKQSYPGRGTGFFGTGYYFTTTPEKCASQGEDRPIYSFSIEGLNLFYGTIDRHEKLKDVCEIISFWPWLSVDMKNWWNLLYSYEKIFPYFDSSYNKVKFGDYLKSNYEYMKGEHPDWYNTFTDYFGDDFNEKNFIERCNNIPELQLLATQLKSAEPDFELINSVTDESGYLDKRWYNEIDENLFKINTVCYAFCDEDKFKNICQTIYEDLKEYYNDNILSRWNLESGLDSITTRFLKALGYDGVYPDPECDNTKYGGVVYDMPKDIQKVGEAKDYISNNRKCKMKRNIFSKLIKSSKYGVGDYVRYDDTNWQIIDINANHATLEFRGGNSSQDQIDISLDVLSELEPAFSSRKLSSSMFGIETSQYSLTELASYLAAFFFDMRNLHLNTTGDSFYTYHKLCQELYEKAEEYYDDLAETATGLGELVPPMNENLPVDWVDYNAVDVGTPATKSLIASELQIILEKLNNVKEDYDSFVYSKLDTMSEYFNTELYKIKQALKNSRNVFSKLIKKVEKV